MPSAMACALPMSRVQTAAARPYSDAFPRSMTSSMSWNFKTDRTGPKISSRAIVMLSVTLSKTVGLMKKPLSPRRSPPVTHLAPSELPFLMYDMIVSYWVLSTWGPCSVSGSNGSPTFRDSTFLLSFSTNSSWASSCTNNRLPAQQHCPWLKNSASKDPFTATSRSASAKMMFGLLPPSSKVSRLSVSAQIFMRPYPTSVEPVNAILSTPGCFARAQRGQGSRRGRLEHARTARGQRRTPLPGGHEQREVPGDDLPSDADRLLLGVAEVVAPDGDDLALDLVGPAGVIAEAVDHERQVDVAALGDWLAVVKGLELGQLVDVLLGQVGEPVHQAAAIAGVHLAPGALAVVERLPRGLDREVDVGGVAHGDFGDDLLGRGVDGLECLATDTVSQLAIDQEFGLILAGLRGTAGHGCCCHGRTPYSG